jgi:hypothetical protein
MKIKINYDSDPLDIIDLVNQVLRVYNLQFVDDGEEHDGFEIYELKNTNT